MTAASIVLLTGQIGFCLLELAQTFKKNRDFIIKKNVVILMTVMFTWFCFGFAVAFGVNNKAADVQFGGFFYGWFGMMNGGLATDPSLNETISVEPLTEVSSTITQE